MAIDTEAKRKGAIAARRLPWFRRFTPVPDGSMTQDDRQQVAFVYRGILTLGTYEPDPDTTYRIKRENRTWVIDGIGRSVTIERENRTAKV